MAWQDGVWVQNSDPWQPGTLDHYMLLTNPREEQTDQATSDGIVISQPSCRSAPWTRRPTHAKTKVRTNFCVGRNKSPNLESVMQRWVRTLVWKGTRVRTPIRSCSYAVTASSCFLAPILRLTLSKKTFRVLLSVTAPSLNTSRVRSLKSAICETRAMHSMISVSCLFTR